ncbi:MAG: V-type ATP synthase subunit B [Candidatus Aenigmarchaeota archaeon]|nr:V-type ATP synthase subunit B [Candidatus Aenigmarchaeota archaeon]
MQEYKTVSQIKNPLVFVKNTKNVGLGEQVKVKTPDNTTRLGEVLSIQDDLCVVEVFEGVDGLDIEKTSVVFLGDSYKIGLSKDMLGGVFDGLGRPKDIEFAIDVEKDIKGEVINPYFRAVPDEFVETGVSVIDGLTTLIRGQKLPVFSHAGMNHNLLLAEIAKNITDSNKKEQIVIFAAMGATNREADFFEKFFEKTGALNKLIMILNHAHDPAMERIVTPRVALTTAEYFAWELKKDVLVILGDMTNYANALRELSSSKEEVPGRFGYPTYLYSDLASIYERTGRIKENKGSITQLIYLTMPDGDITHPVPDLSGYITEGQIILSPTLKKKGIFPPINIIPSLSRMMHKGIGEKYTQDAHMQLSNQIYSAYSEGLRLESLMSVVGEDALTARDKKYIEFKKNFEVRFINQKEKRTIKQTLFLGWRLLSIIPKEELTKIEKKYIEKYME